MIALRIESGEALLDLRDGLYSAFGLQHGIDMAELPDCPAGALLPWELLTAGDLVIQPLPQVLVEFDRLLLPFLRSSTDGEVRWIKSIPVTVPGEAFHPDANAQEHDGFRRAGHHLLRAILLLAWNAGAHGDLRGRWTLGDDETVVSAGRRGAGQ